MSRRAVILSAVPVSTALCRYVQPGDFVVACDAGYRNAERLDLRPDLIVGDFDSAPQPKTERETIVLPHVKDDTVISGLYGMNVRADGMPFANSTAGFAIVLGLTLALCILSAWVLHKKHML